MKKVYLDNAATTKTAPEVVEDMKPYFLEKYGNASCLHKWGQEARDAVETSRELIANKINALSEEIIFTSGGSEANNLAIKGVAYQLKEKGNHIVVSEFEHPAVLNTCRALEKKGFEITYVAVDKQGFVNLEQLKNSITNKTVLVSIMHANNEIGTIQNLEEIGKICNENDVLFHSDCVQSLGKVGVDVKKFNLSLATFSAHKIHGPKGIGVLYVKKGVKLCKQIDGGPQEFNQRAGTENVSGIIGFARAIDIITEEDVRIMRKMRDYLVEELLKIDGTSLNGSKENRLCNNVSVAFQNVEGESILLSLDDKGIAVSTSSACTSSKLESSHVLKAIGLKPEDSHGTIRFTLSKYTTKEELDYVIESVGEIVKNLRRISP
ncbi:aminotransferase class V-fold PLP-dependent enzyme [Candidatus Woesearchaeota archaeon]|nr:aminotransferase class V-fold PLP-dependent enzyme [Candidatus Woesearchaeota archaeon]